jgi:hypothetical protein
MKLVYSTSGREVKVGDKVVLRDGRKVTVDYFREPHKASSEGKVTVKAPGQTMGSEYYVSVIGAEWVEREDRLAEPEVTVRRVGGAA